MLQIDPAAILAFRLSRHHLARRLPERSLVGAVATAGVQETRLRTAVVALHARVGGVTGATLDRALAQDQTLLTIWAMRGAPYVVPTGDAAVFTTGALPTGEDSWRAFFGGWGDALRDRNLSFAELVEKAAEAARAVLDGRQLPVEELRQAIAGRMPELRGLTPPAGAHADLPEPLFRATGLLGVVCTAGTRRMTDVLLARTDQWLGTAPQTLDPDAAPHRPAPRRARHDGRHPRRFELTVGAPLFGCANLIRRKGERRDGSDRARRHRRHGRGCAARLVPRPVDSPG